MDKSLDNIVTLFSGNAWKSASFKQIGKMPIIRIQNIGENKSKEFIYWDEEYNDNFIVNKGDLLLSLSGSIKLDFWDGEPALLNQRIVKIIPKKGIDTHWLFFQLKNYIRKITNMGNHALVNNVSLTDLKKLTLKVPEYETQLYIANLLSKAENLISQRKESIRLLDEFLKSTFLEMFGDAVKNEKKWKKSELKNYAKVRIGPFGSLLHREDYVLNGVPLVNPSHISEGKIVVDSELTISPKKMTELSAYVMHEGDVVLGRRGEIGRCAVVTRKEDGYLCGTGSIFIRPTEKLNSIFLYNIISSASMRKVLENSAKGITMKNLNSGIIENLKIPVPPIEIQTQFAQIVEKTEALKTQYQQSLQELENLYGSLSQKAFRGELTSNKAISV